LNSLVGWGRAGRVDAEWVGGHDQVESVYEWGVHVGWGVVGLHDCTKAGLLLLFLMTFSNVVYFIFVVRNRLAFLNPPTHDQRRIIGVGAPLAL
jgi:hypothetical protein